MPSIRTAAWADLDVLCLTAMHEDASRRYQSVHALIRDIDHYLADEPLEARPDTLQYTLGKFVGRNWRGMSAAAVVAGVVGTLAVMVGMSLSATAPRPMNAEAYDLYLRSAGGRYDPGPRNREQIAMLERAVTLDPTYAPAWLSLSRRYLVESRYGNGSEAMLEKAIATNERARELDPSLIAAAGRLAILHTERGDLPRAYREAQELVRRRPDSPDAHFALSYVLRFAGLMEEASRECGTAVSLDPHNWGWRSCVVVSLALGDTDGAKGYIQLDLGSEWAKALTIHTLVREGRTAEALKIGKPDMPQWKSYDLLLACIGGRPAPEIRTLAAAVQPDMDPEVDFHSAAHLSYCGQMDQALQLLARAIRAGYCSYPAIDTDPFFARVRAQPEFASVRAAGLACQKTFLAQRPALAQ
jgi:tetratricopeptide (TPR) repeat protein